MISGVVNNALMDAKLSFLNAAIISHSFKSFPDEIIADALEECTATGVSGLIVPFRYPPLLCLFDNATSAQSHVFPATPRVSAIQNNKGFKQFESELGKYGFCINSILVDKDYAEITITKTPPEMPIKLHQEIKLG